MKSRPVLVLFAFLFTAFCALSAQTFRGSIQGTVTDPSGAAVPAAQVKVSSSETGFSRTVATNDHGEYVVSELPLGTYSVTASKQGLNATTFEHVPVSVGAVQRADIKMSMGEVREKVEVTAEVPMVETSTDTLGGTIEGEQAAQLPVNGRDYTKILELVPGAVSDPNGSTESAGSYGLMSVNGNRGRSNNYLLDGTDMNDGYRNLPSVNQAGVWGCPSTLLPLDAIAEVPVTASPDAEFGRSSGATVNLVTKSGTDQIHGSFYEYYRNGDLGARNFFNSDDQPKNPFTNHQFGASLGGPIVKDKTFWFFSYEGQRENGSIPQLGNAPTQADINTALQSIKAQGLQPNPVMMSVLALNPWGTYNNGAFTMPFNNNINSLIFKVDQHLNWFSDSDLLTGRYYRGSSTQLFPLGMLTNNGIIYDTQSPNTVNIVSLSYTSAPKSNLIWEVRGGYNRFLQDFWPQDSTFNPLSIGLDTLPPGSTSRDFGLPTITVGDYSAIGATSSVSRGRVDTNYDLFGNVSYTLGTHALKWGYEWRRTFIDSFIDSGHRGSLDFDSLQDFLLGNIDTSSSLTGSAAGYSTRDTYQNADGLYLQDSWRASRRLTLNYGLRWEYFGVVGDQNNQFSLFNPATDSLIQNVKQLYPKDWKNFAPRLSFAYDLLGNGKAVVRGGYGIFYDGPSQDFFVGNQPWNTLPAQAGPDFNNIQFASTVTPTIVAGQPVFGGYGQGTPSAFTVAQNLTTPYYQSYNLNIESQVSKTIAVQVGYVGSVGRHLFRFRDLNQVDNVAGSTYSCGNGTTVTYGESCFPNFVYINQVETTASSSYNSLQTAVKMRNWHGLSSTFNYTWAHSIDDASDGLDFVPNAAQPDNSFNPKGEFASSNFDIRQRVQWFWTYDLPKYSSAKWITNGWSLDGVFNFATGQPYTVSYIYEGDYNGSGEFFGRPDIIGNPYAGTGGTNLLNLSAFAAPCTWDTTLNSGAGGCIPGTQHPGNEGRNMFRAPNYANFDFSLNKTSHLTERLTMQLRADIFNILNHPNFSNPLLPSFGVDAFTNAAPNANGTRLIGGAPNSQFLQATATPDVGSGNPYLGGGGPRTFQLSARFMF
jgi:hypothetical protein